MQGISRGSAVPQRRIDSTIDAKYE
jgi:hypothetical protein